MKRYNIIIGGPAGTGPNILTHLLGEALIKKGYFVFYSRDYQSLIRGGHNFNQLTFSDKPVYSNDSKIDILVALDKQTIKIHSNNLKKDSIILEGHTKNMHYAGILFKLLGIEFNILDKELGNLKKFYKENLKEAKEAYENEKRSVIKLKSKKDKKNFINGNQGISEGAIKSKLDIYYAYPMTPATPILAELAKAQKNIVLELENEIGVANAGVGSAMTGALTMVGTSGGGFDLMGETYSLCGVAEIPLVFYLSQRPGPGTGVATYTAQGDLNIARHSGHGEFPRIVLAPGDPAESEELINQAMYLSQKFQNPAVVISDKHLGESFYSCKKKAKMIKVPRMTKLKRYNSYEKDSEGSASEEINVINANVKRRNKKENLIEKESRKFSRYSVYGNKKSKNVVVGWGSTKGAILDSIKDLYCKFVQIKYIEPFPKDVEKELKENLILVENNSTGLLGQLIREKTGIEIKKKILRYDGRPFLADELNKKIKKELK